MFLLCRNETNGLLEKMEDVPGPFFNNLQTIYFINCAASDVSCVRPYFPLLRAPKYKYMQGQALKTVSACDYFTDKNSVM